MINQIIIDEFKRLIAYLRDETDKYIKNKNRKMVRRNTFRLRQNKNILVILKNYPNKITLKNYNELKELSGIGKGTIDRIKEILQTGKLKELKNFTDEKGNKKKVLNKLEQVVGIGRTKALELYDLGILDIKTLKKKIKSKEISVNDKILLGLKYHGVYKLNIPRDEIDKIYKLVKKTIKKMNKKYNLPDNKKYHFEICGSYRREKPFSNDIDILLTKFKSTKTKDKHLKRFIKKLKKPLKYNNNKPLLVDDMTDKKIQTKYMGFCKYKNNPVRRIDIRFVPYTSFISALLYFTGSGNLNKKMRQIAKKKNINYLNMVYLMKIIKKLKLNQKEIFLRN